MLLLQEESALVARDFWRSAPPLVAVPSELLAFELEAGSPSPPPQTERELATKEGKKRGDLLKPSTPLRQYLEFAGCGPRRRSAFYALVLAV